MKQDFNADKPMTFGHMTLFASPTDGLVLHTLTQSQGRVLGNVSTERIANGYLNYQKKQTERYMELAEAHVSHFENCMRAEGKLKPVTLQKRQEILENTALRLAANDADNRENGHDLSPEFCENAKKLGEALMQFYNMGYKTITLHDSYRSPENVMASYMRPKAA